MAAKTDIELALANLEAGKFSFRMVETIKDHVSTLETDLACAKSEAENATKTLRERDFTVARLEAELRKVNSRVHALVKANELTQVVMRESARGVGLLRDAGAYAGKEAVALSKAAAAWLSSIDVKAEVEKAKAHPLTVKAQARLAAFDLQAEWKKLQAHPLTEKALHEFETALAKAQAYLPVARKQAAALVEKAQAFIANLNKKAA